MHTHSPLCRVRPKSNALHAWAMCAAFRMRQQGSDEMLWTTHRRTDRHMVTSTHVGECVFVFFEGEERASRCARRWPTEPPARSSNTATRTWHPLLKYFATQQGAARCCEATTRSRAAGRRCGGRDSARKNTHLARVVSQESPSRELCLRAWLFHVSRARSDCRDQTVCMGVGVKGRGWTHLRPLHQPSSLCHRHGCLTLTRQSCQLCDCLFVPSFDLGPWLHSSGTPPRQELTATACASTLSSRRLKSRALVATLWQDRVKDAELSLRGELADVMRVTGWNADECAVCAHPQQSRHQAFIASGCVCS
jgi:hypothetical protein